MIRVLIVDDHAIVRQGLRLLLEGQPNIEVVGEAADGAMALQCIQRLAPDVVLLDLLMPVVSGIDVLHQIEIEGIKSKILVLTSSLDDQLVKQALASGATGYLLKTSRSREVVSAIQQVADGIPILDSAATQVMIQQTKRQDELDTLTAREREVFDQMALGRNTTEIAQALMVSEATIRTHTANILDKLALRDRVQVMAYALKRGLVHPKDLQ
jgi:DNA-binding NarL/FixJ family response regulator